MHKYLVWLKQPNMTFEEIQAIGVFIEVKDTKTAVSRFAAASGLRPNAVGCMGPIEYKDAVRKNAERAAKAAKEQAAGVEAEVADYNQQGILHPNQLDLKYKIASTGGNRTVREWIVAAVEAEGKLAKLKEQL
jgi:hypothetical protein